MKCCVVGLLTLPLATPLLLAASMALAPDADVGRKIGFGASVVVWLGMFGCAQLLTSVYPPVPRQRR